VLPSIRENVRTQGCFTWPATAPFITLNFRFIRVIQVWIVASWLLLFTAPMFLWYSQDFWLIFSKFFLNRFIIAGILPFNFGAVAALHREVFSFKIILRLLVLGTGDFSIFKGISFRLYMNHRNLVLITFRLKYFYALLLRAITDLLKIILQSLLRMINLLILVVLWILMLLLTT